MTVSAITQTISSSSKTQSNDKGFKMSSDVLDLVITYLTPEEAAKYAGISKVFNKGVCNQYLRFISEKAGRSSIFIFVHRPDLRIRHISDDVKGMIFNQRKINKKLDVDFVDPCDIPLNPEKLSRGYQLDKCSYPSFCPTLERYEEIVIHLRSQLDKHPELINESCALKLLVQAGLTYEQGVKLAESGYSLEGIFHEVFTGHLSNEKNELFSVVSFTRV